MISSSSRASVAKQALRVNGVRRSTSTLARSSARVRMAASLKKAVVPRQALQYSTEQVLRLRDSKVDPEQRVLYDASNEKDNCGVGLIANLKSKPSRHVVEVADEMLVRMSHRGGCGCDPASGDGAGMFFIRV